jgi:hypothetical protein
VANRIIEDLGGHSNINGKQRILLDVLKSKLAVVLRISDYADRQKDIIKDGELIPCLGRNYLAYTNGIRLTLQELYKHWDGSKPVKTLEEYLAEAKAETEKSRVKSRQEPSD